MRRIRMRRVVTLSVITMTMLAALAVPALADGPAEGCFRIEYLVDGSSGDISWTFDGTDSVSVSGPVASVTVKGGPDEGAFYDTPPFENLTAPWNPNSGKPYGISHVDICPGDEPDSMCQLVPPGEPGTTTTHAVNGTTVDISWEADGFSWDWADGLDPRHLRLRVQVARGESLLFRGQPEGSYVGPYIAVNFCYCPQTR